MHGQTRLRGRVLCLAIGAVLSAGCSETLSPQEQVESVEALGPGIHPVLSVSGRSGDTTRVELSFRRVAVDAQVASFQGELSLKAGRLALVGAEIPAGVVGAWNEAEPGRVRFAGAALDGLGERPALVLRVVSREEVRSEDLTLRLEELVAASGFQSLADQVVQREHPVVVRVSTP